MAEGRTVDSVVRGERRLRRNALITARSRYPRARFADRSAGLATPRAGPLKTLGYSLGTLLIAETTPLGW
jgi:hypothetical protein